MPYSKPARTAGRRGQPRILATVVVASAAVVGFLICQSLTSSTTASPIESSRAASPVDTPPGDHQRALGETGRVRDGVTVFDDQTPGVANLDPALLSALREAATDANDDEVEFYVTSGWRSPEYQQQLLDEAVTEYGSEEEARRWVATPETSAHVSGDAVDIGASDAAAWLSENGSEYGLCQIYDNEPWHYELRPEAVDHGCPRMYADPTHDPRMQQ
jgi:D-alanyl-D-alanine carboxypeptidase